MNASVQSNLAARTAEAKASALADARRLVADLERFVSDLEDVGGAHVQSGWWSRMAAQIDVSYARYSALLEVAAAMDWSDQS